MRRLFHIAVAFGVAGALAAAHSNFVRHALAQSAVTVIGQVTPGDCAVFNSQTIIKDGTPTCGRTIIAAPVTLFINPTSGSDLNNCLGPGTSACATPQRAGQVYSQNYVVNSTVTLQWANGTYNNLSGQEYFVVPPYYGSGNIVLQGNVSSPDAVSLQMTSVANAIFDLSYIGNRYTIQGFKLSSTVGSGNGNAIFVQGSTLLNYGSIDFGAFVGGLMVSGEFGAQIVKTSNNTISGSAAAYMACQDGAVCHNTTGTDTFTGTPNFSTATFYAHGPGAVVGVTAAVFSGSATGTKCEADAGGYVDVDSPSNLPGNSSCVVLSSGSVGGVIGATNPIIVNTIFANLPASPISGQFAHITDGLAANCNPNCTTFGAVVSAGNGALPLFIGFNGTNWTLMGK